MHRGNERTYRRVAGGLLLAAGVALFIIGLNASDSLADQWSDFFTGHSTDATVLYIIAGIASMAVGLLLVMFAGRTATVRLHGPRAGA